MMSHSSLPLGVASPVPVAAAPVLVNGLPRPLPIPTRAFTPTEPSLPSSAPPPIAIDLALPSIDKHINGYADSDDQVRLLQAEIDELEGDY
jgi:hypothetical protein